VPILSGYPVARQRKNNIVWHFNMNKLTSPFCVMVSKTIDDDPKESLFKTESDAKEYAKMMSTEGYLAEGYLYTEPRNCKHLYAYLPSWYKPPIIAQTIEVDEYSDLEIEVEMED
jgi:hypothetical protein